MSRLGDFGTALLRRLPPEQAHRATIRLLASGLAPRATVPNDPRLAVSLAGIALKNPLGLAPGFDKSGEVPDAALDALGLSYAEIGSVTPRPQRGNPEPRLFRLPEAGALINRMGFNNDGADAVLARLSARAHKPGIVGVNVGANKDSADRVADYARGIAAFAPVAAYLTVNVSSPNTPGLRDLQESAALDALLARALEARDAAPRRVALFLKIAPDLDDLALAAVAEVAIARGVDGLVVGNTTLSRVGVTGQRTAAEAGGLSGRPLFRRSTIMLARARRLVGPALPLIGVGGIASADDAWEKIRAGAHALQLYTALVFEGPGLVARILEGLVARLDAEGHTALSAVVGTGTDEWARQPLITNR